MVAPSKLWERCSCHEICHTWNPSCIGATLDVAKASYQYSFKTYVLFYLASNLIFHRGIPNVKKLVKDILISTNFLASNAIFFLSTICLLRHVIGRFFTWFAWGPAFTASALAISLEKKSRRPTLALYMATLAIELLTNIFVARGWVTPIKRGEVILFSVSAALGMYLYRYGNVLKKDTLSALKLLVGGQELPRQLQDVTATPQSLELKNENATSASRGQQMMQASPMLVLVKKRFMTLVNWIKDLPKHNLCPHQSSCVHYSLQSFLRNFAAGYVIQMALNLLKTLPRIFAKPSLLLQALVRQDNFDLALFLSLFSGIFRCLSCLLRWLRSSDSPLHALIAGGAAGASSIFYRSSTISLYFASKLVESLLIKGQAKGIIPIIPHADIIIYSLSTATLLHAGAYEPHNIRPAYWRFLQNLTGSNFGKFNRMLIAHLGTNATKLFPDWPVYPDPSKLKIIDMDGVCVRSLQPTHK